MRRLIVLNHALRIASALALLVSVMSSPIRPNVSRGISSPDHLKRNFGIPGKAPTSHRPHVPVPSRVVQVKALSSEGKLDFAAIPCYLHIGPASGDLLQPEPARHPCVPCLDRASHSLRC